MSSTHDYNSIITNNTFNKKLNIQMRYSCGSIPFDFWLYHNEFTNSFKSKLNEFSNIGNINCINKWPKLGQKYGFIKDQKYFRGEILSTTLPFSIRDIDSGKEFHVDIFDLFQIPANIWNIPTQALHCTLDSEESELCKFFDHEQLINIIYGADLIVTIKKKRTRDGVFVVDIQRVHPIKKNSVKLIEILKQIQLSMEISNNQLQNPSCIDNNSTSSKSDNISTSSQSDNYSTISKNNLFENFHNKWPLHDYLEKAKAGQTFFAMVSCIHSPENIYFHKVNQETTNIDKFKNKIHNFYSKCSFVFENIQHLKSILHFDKSPRKILCAALFKGIFYRAQILDILFNNNIKVLYVDYGNEEIVTYKKIKPLCDDFAMVPFYAEPLKLAGIKKPIEDWTMNHINKLESYMKCDNMTFQLEMKTDTEAELFTTKGENINILFNKWLDLQNSHSPKTNYNLNQSFEMNTTLCYGCSFGNRCNDCSINSKTIFKSINVFISSTYIGEFAKVNMLHITESGLFYVSLIDYTYKDDTLESILKEINCKEHDNLSSPPVCGELVLVKFEDLYQRAIVIKIKNLKIFLFLIDKGRNIDVTFDKLKILDKRWKDFPAQAILCSLANAEVFKDKVSLQQFRHHCLKEMEVQFMMREENNCAFSVMLYTLYHQNIGIELIRSSSAKPRLFTPMP